MTHNDRTTLRHPSGKSRQRTIAAALGTAAGAALAAALASLSSAPAAHADDLTEILSPVQGDFTAGQTAFGDAATDFGSGDVSGGLVALLDGVNDDVLSAPDNLLIGTVEALTNESITPSIVFDLIPPTDFADGLTLGEESITEGVGELQTGATDFSTGDFGTGTAFDLLGSEAIVLGPLDYLLLGVGASF